MSEEEEVPTGPVVPVCRHCGSGALNRDAWASWDAASQTWQLGATYDAYECRACGAEMKWVNWLELAVYRKRQIARLNDRLRQGEPGPHDRLVMTQGVAALGEVVLAHLARKLTGFDAFDTGDDPYQERDFGVLTVGTERFYFKIDYFNLELDGASPDPADPTVTARVLTLMLASEY